MKRISPRMNFVVLNIIIAFSLFTLILYTNSPNVEAQAGQESPELYKEYQKKVTELKESTDKLPPRQQLAFGIRYYDVFCYNDFVLLFKWASNSPACVKPQSVDKLVERGWGVPKDQTILLVRLTQCETAFTIQYNDPSQYRESKIIKTIRDALSEVDLTYIVEDYTYVWEYISIWNEPDNEGKVNVSVEGHYSDSVHELQKEGYNEIIDALQRMKGVANVKVKMTLCE
ncbi:MAG: hypothetical protein IH948_09405 [Bacteroidetes bacterium]|nr:hypothetical protein [Bacteroidota bacterium]